MAEEHENVEKIGSKKKKGSMKRKKSWRKKTDIVDVEEHLDDLRRQERSGGIISEKTDEDLFFIEKKTQAENDSSAQTGKTEVSKDTNELAQSSDEEEFVPRKVRLQRRRASQKMKEQMLLEKVVKANTDVWARSSIVEGDSWIDSTKDIRPKKPKSAGAKPSSLKSVEICHPGASYNPEYEDHQDILGQALEKQKLFLKEKEKLQNKLKFLEEEEFKKKPSWLQEMGEGLIPTEEKKSAEVLQPEEDVLILPKTVNPDDRKTTKQRKKELERRKEDRVKEEERSKRLRLNDIYRLRKLKKELRDDESKKADKIRQKKELFLRKSLKPKRLGRLKYREPKIDFQLSEELAGSFRGLRPEGDPFIDRIKSFEKRSLIEPRRKVIPHRKFKVKYVDKRSYKEPTVKEFVTATKRM